jgi:hypothetical protein
LGEFSKQAARQRGLGKLGKLSMLAIPLLAQAAAGARDLPKPVNGTLGLLARLALFGEAVRIPYAVIPTTDPQGHCFASITDPTEKLVIESPDQLPRSALYPDHSVSSTSGYTVNGQDLVDACGLTPARISDPRGGVIQVLQVWAFGACIPSN